CGDGATSMSDGLGSGRSFMYVEYSGGREWTPPPCVHGPMRVTVRVVEGQPSTLRVMAGPLPVLGDSVLDLGMVSTTDAGTYLRTLARRGDGRAAQQALLPMILVDSQPRWDVLADAARDSTKPQSYRRRASDLLARGAVSTLGTEAFADDGPASERRTAVRALAQRRTRDDDPVPQLLEIAQTNKHPDVRAAAIQQLAQYADPRAIAMMATMLGVR
ncbi:MAG: HEAT repeat domain-containing protein, partial [Gemmatimonadaceae bacterium]